MTQGLDKARELLPVITIAKETLDAGVKVDGCATYSEYLAHLGVTVDQVRQWRRRLKKAGDAITPMPTKRAKRDSTPVHFIGRMGEYLVPACGVRAAEQIVTKEPQQVTCLDCKAKMSTVTPKLAVHFRTGSSTYSRCNKPVGLKYSNPTTKSWDKVTCDACRENKPPDLIIVPLTTAQMREVEHGGVRPKGVFRGNKDIRFPAAEYQEKAKRLVEALEQRIADLNKEAGALAEANRDLYLESDLGASDEARELKKKVAKLKGAATACEGAIRVTTFGDTSTDDTARNIREWYEPRRDEQLGVPEPAPEPSKKEQPMGVTTMVKPLGVVLESVHVEDEYGSVNFDLDQESEYIYHGAKNHKWERLTFTWSPTKTDWHYQFYDLRGSMTVKVFLPGTDEATVTEALLVKFREMLTRLNMWRDDLEREYRDMAREGLEYQAEQKRERSDRAKQAAVTRKRRKEQGRTRTEKISAIIKDANTDGNSSRAMKAAKAAGTRPED